jgi:hypothetical protein
MNQAAILHDIGGPGQAGPIIVPVTFAEMREQGDTRHLG